MNKKDSRKYPRVKITFPVEYTLGDRQVRGRASALGGGGLFLKEASAPTGTELVLRFRPARHLPLLEAKGKVVYHLPGQGTGVEFTDISAEDQQLLLRWIHHRRADRRFFPRVLLVTQVYCQECMWLANSRDISLGGMFIETKQAMPAGSRLTLRFHLDDGGPIMELVAETRYAVPKAGLGVQFIELMPAERQRLAAFVARGAPLPEFSPQRAPHA